MQRAFFAYAWDISNSETRGPFETKADAWSWLDDMSELERKAVIGPVPIEYDTEREVAKPMQWAVFKLSIATRDWMVFGDSPEAFDNQPAGKDGLTWLGNFEGTTPAEVYRQLKEDEYPLADDEEFQAIPIGVFGPTDWMRQAGKLLQNVE